MSPPVGILYEFGHFRLDTREQLLLRNGEPVALTPTVFSIFEVLVRNSGHLVSKDQLLREVWPDTFVEEANLTVHISSLRKALGEPNYIETVPSRGYRFTPSTRQLSASGLELFAETDASLRSGIQDNVRQVDTFSGRRRVIGWGILSTATLLLIASIVLGLYKLSAGDNSRAELPEPFQKMKLTRLTSSGNATNAAISSDGKYIVHALGDAGSQSLWLRNIKTNGSTQIVSPAEVEYLGLAFSADGNHIYYAVRENNKLFGTLYQLPLPGGTSRRLIDGASRAITVSPDGLQVAFVRDDRDRKESFLIVITVDQPREQVLASRKMPERFWSPAWSPDGKAIACVVESYEAQSRYVSVIEVAIPEGTEKLITSRIWDDVIYLAWLSDGSGLVLTARDEASRLFQIWEVASEGGQVRRITNDLNDYWQISSTADSNTLAAIQFDRVSNIWVIPKGEGSGIFGYSGGFPADARRAKPITNGGGKYFALTWTPDGKIVYGANMNGNNDIWMMEANGTNQRQLTFDPHSDLAPSVSPDGRYIVFVSDRTGTSQVWRMDGDGGDLKQLTHGIPSYWPQFSPDGRWVVYHSGAMGNEGLWKVPVDGGESVQITSGNMHWPTVSPDGKLIACFYHDGSKNSSTSIAVVPFDGGEPQKVIEITPGVNQRTGLQWTTNGRGLLYVDKAGGVSNIWEQPLDGGSARQLTNFSDDQIFGFAWTENGKLLACSRGVATSDVVLISNFR